MKPKPPQPPPRPGIGFVNHAADTELEEERYEKVENIRPSRSNTNNDNYHVYRTLNRAEQDTTKLIETRKMSRKWICEFVQTCFIVLLIIAVVFLFLYYKIRIKDLESTVAKRSVFREKINLMPDKNTDSAVNSSNNAEEEKTVKELVMTVENEIHKPCKQLLKEDKFDEIEDCEGKKDGIYKLSSTLQRVNCEKEWLIIQQREFPYGLDFYRSWNEYRQGFGTPCDEYWTGLAAVHKLTNKYKYKVRLDMLHQDGVEERYTEYSSFKVASEAHNYTLDVSGVSGTAGDILRCSSANNAKLPVNGMAFSTFDRDNDRWEAPSCLVGCFGSHRKMCQPTNCAICYLSGWWYNDCFGTNLNTNDNGGDMHYKDVAYFNCVELVSYLRATKIMIKRA